MPCDHRFCVTIEYENKTAIHKVVKPVRINGTLCVGANVKFKHGDSPAKLVTFRRNDGTELAVEAATRCAEPSCNCTSATCTIPIAAFDE